MADWSICKYAPALNKGKTCVWKREILHTHDTDEPYLQLTVAELRFLGWILAQTVPIENKAQYPKQIHTF